MDLTGPGRSRAAGSPHECLTEKQLVNTAKPALVSSLLPHNELYLTLTSHGAATGNLPEDEAHGVDVSSFERLKMLHVYGVVQNLWSHIPEDGYDGLVSNAWSKNTTKYSPH